MMDPTLVVLLGPQAARLSEKIARVAQDNAAGIRIVPVVADPPVAFLQTAQTADIYYAYATPAAGTDADASLAQSLDEIAAAAADLLTARDQDSGVSRLLITLVGYADCRVTLALWKTLADGIRTRLRARLAGLAPTINLHYAGLIGLPLEAEGEATRGRDSARYAWLREAYACNWFRHLFFLSRAGADVTGASRPVLTEEEADDLMAAAVHALAATGLIDEMPMPLLNRGNEMVASSLGLCFLDLPIARLRLQAARTAVAEMIDALLQRRRRVLPDEVQQALALEQLDGTGLLERLLATSRPGENLISILLLPALEYNQLPDLGEVPDRLRSYSSWLGQQYVVQLADKVDANATTIRAALPQDVYRQTALRADGGADSSPDFGRNFLVECWDLSAEMKRRVDEATSLSALALAYGDNDLATLATIDTINEEQLEGCYTRLATAVRTRVVPLAVYLRYGLLGVLTASVAFVRLREQFGTLPTWVTAVLLLLATVVPAILTCLQSRRRIRRCRDDYMSAIIAYHRGTFFRYTIEQLRKVIDRLQDVIGDPTSYRDEEKYAQSARRTLEDAAAALDLRGKAFRTPLPPYGNSFIRSVEAYIEPFPVYRFRRWEIDNPNLMLGELQSSRGVGWLPNPDDNLDVRLDAVARRIFTFCDEGFAYLNEVSLLSLLAAKESRPALGILRDRLELTARYYHPAQPVIGNKPIWFMGLRGATRGDILQVLGAPQGWMHQVNDLAVIEMNRLVTINLGWHLDLGSVPLFRYWERAYRAEPDLTAWHPGVADPAALPDPLADPAPVTAPDREQGLDFAVVPEPLP